MADVMVGSERRVLISGGYGSTAPESLLCRLDQIDLRLRQLEEEQRRPAAHHAGDDDASAAAVRRAPQHQHTKSLPSALQHVQLRGTLVDRLNMLESRIRQLSCELDLDAAAAAGDNNKAAAGSLGLVVGSSSASVAAPRPPPPPAEDRAWSETAPMLEPCRDPMMVMRAPDNKAAAGDGGRWSAVEMLQRGAGQLHRNNRPDNNASSNKQVNDKSTKETKCACQKEKKKKAERKRASRRWFGVGC